MVCPKCGHENPDIRLFCANCGEILPEKSEDAPKTQPAAEADAAFTRPEAEDVPEAAPAEETRKRAVEVTAWPAVAEPGHEENSAPSRPSLKRRGPVDSGRANTYIPKRSEKMEPEDFFAVKGQVLPEYDEEKRPARPQKRSGNKFEDDAPQSFAVRHMRGIVTLILLAVTLVIILIWVNTDNAQLAMAKIGVSWKSEAYAELGAQAYAAGDLSGAGYYYTQALDRDENNSDYAVMAANSYIEGGYTAKALDALRECIRIAPGNADLYAALMDLQAGYENMPASDRQLVDEGYRLTGDERLNKK